MPKKIPEKTKDLPVTRAMLSKVRAEMNERLNRAEADIAEAKLLLHQLTIRLEEQRSENLVRNASDRMISNK